MTLPQSLLLGLIQGLTEFLPVSSSGHLVIFQKLLGFKSPPVAFDVLVHLGTLVSILIVFRNQIKTITRNTLIAIILGSIPTALIGLFLNSISEQLFNSLTLVAIALIITSVLLISTKFGSRKTNQKNISKSAAVIIGIIQGIAVIPGISRSGSTISLGLLLGLTKKTAVSFSFLLSIPAVLGAQILQFGNYPQSSAISPGAYLLGFMSAVFSGWISIRCLQSIVEKSRLHWFAAYTLFVAILILLS